VSSVVEDASSVVAVSLADVSVVVSSLVEASVIDGTPDDVGPSLVALGLPGLESAAGVDIVGSGPPGVAALVGVTGDTAGVTPGGDASCVGWVPLPCGVSGVALGEFPDGSSEPQAANSTLRSRGCRTMMGRTWSC